MTVAKVLGAILAGLRGTRLAREKAARATDILNGIGVEYGSCRGATMKLRKVGVVGTAFELGW